MGECYAECEPMRASLWAGMENLSTKDNQTMGVFCHRDPLIREKPPQPVDGTRHDSAKNIIEILPGVHITGLA